MVFLYGKHYSLVKSKTLSVSDEFSDIGSSLLLFRCAHLKQKSLWELYGGKAITALGVIGSDAILCNIRDAATNKYRIDTQKSIKKLKCWIKGGAVFELHLGNEC